MATLYHPVPGHTFSVSVTCPVTVCYVMMNNADVRQQTRRLLPNAITRLVNHQATNGLVPFRDNRPLQSTMTTTSTPFW